MAPRGKSSPPGPLKGRRVPTRSALWGRSQAAPKPRQERKALCPAAKNHSAFPRQLPLIPQSTWQAPEAPPPAAFPLSLGIKVWTHLCHYPHPGGSSHEHPWLSRAERASVSLASASPGRPGGQKRRSSAFSSGEETLLHAGGQAGHPLPLLSQDGKGLEAPKRTLPPVKVVLPSSFL